MEGEDQSPAAPPGFTKVSPSVYLGNSKIFKTSLGADIPTRIRINSKTANWQLETSYGQVLVVGSPISGLRIERFSIASNIPNFDEEIKNIEKNTKETLVNLSYSDPESNKSNLDTPYYRNIRPSTTGKTQEGNITSAQGINNLKIEASKESQKFGTMRYPLKSGGTNLDYIKFEIFESVPSKFGGYPDKDGKIQGRIGQFTNKEYAKLIGTIYLPIQPNIGDVNAVDWGEDTMGLLQMTAANISLAITGGGAATTENIADQISLEAAANRDDIIKAVRASLADTLAKSGSNVFTRVTGAMLNPNLELLFKGPKLRQFDYTIRLTPRSPEEGNMVRKIIRAFKQNMAPRLAANNYFLQTPNVFSIDYVLNNGTNIKGLNKIKKSALMSCSVNYTPANNYMPFKDGTMTSYELTLRFQELLPIYDSDYLSEFTDAELNTEESATDNITIGY